MQPMILGMHILVVAKFLVAGVKENTQTVLFTPPMFLGLFLRHLC